MASVTLGDWEPVDEMPTYTFRKGSPEGTESLSPG